MSRMRSEIPSWNYARHIFLKHDLLVLVITVADNFSQQAKVSGFDLPFSDVRMEASLDERHRARIERMMVEEEEEVKQLEVSSTIYDDDSDSKGTSPRRGRGRG